MLLKMCSMSKRLKKMEQLTFLLMCFSEKQQHVGFKKHNDRILDQQTSHDSQKLLSGPKTRNMSSRLHLVKRFSQLNTISSPGTPFFLSQYTFPSLTSLSGSFPFLTLCSSSAPLWGMHSFSPLIYLSLCQRTAEGPCTDQREELLFNMFMRSQLCWLRNDQLPFLPLKHGIVVSRDMTVWSLMFAVIGGHVEGYDVKFISVRIPETLHRHKYKSFENV